MTTLANVYADSVLLHLHWQYVLHIDFPASAAGCTGACDSLCARSPSTFLPERTNVSSEVRQC